MCGRGIYKSEGVERDDSLRESVWSGNIYE